MILLNKKFGNCNNVDFSVEIALNAKICILHINEYATFFEDVDLAQVIRAVENSTEIADVAENIKGIWREERILPLIKSFALAEINALDFWKVLCESDEWIQRKMDTISNTLRKTESLSDEWFKYRAMMYDCVIQSGVLNE